MDDFSFLMREREKERERGLQLWARNFVRCVLLMVAARRETLLKERASDEVDGSTYLLVLCAPFFFGSVETIFCYPVCVFVYNMKGTIR